MQLGMTAKIRGKFTTSSGEKINSLVRIRAFVVIAPLESHPRFPDVLVPGATFQGAKKVLRPVVVCVTTTG